MSTGWDAVGELARKHERGAGGLFVKLAGDGDSVVGVFVGEPFAREVHWTGKGSEPCAGPGCEFCFDKRPSLKIAMSIYLPEAGEVRVFEAAGGWFSALTKAREKYGLGDWTFELQRHGATGDLKTSYSVLPHEKVDDALRAELAAVRPHDLEALLGGGAPRASYSKPVGRISEAALARIVVRVRARPQDGEELLSRFGVARLRDLPAADVPAAEALLDELEATAPPDWLAGTGEADPFA